MIIITAATGRYGRLVIDALLRRGVPANDIVAAAREPEKAADLTAKGVQVRQADYDRPETLGPAFAGADKLLLVPSANVGQRYPEMQRAVAAAVASKVGLLAYAGFVNSDISTLCLGNEHKQTEALIRVSGLPHVMLRNGSYIEMYSGDLGDVGHALASGLIFGAAGDGKISGASRADLAEAAAVVLTSEGQAGRIYELGGTPFTMTDIASEIGRHTGKHVAYRDMPVDQYARALEGAGLPEPLAQIIADTSLAVKNGDWYTDSKDLEQLIGRTSTPLSEVVAATLRRNGIATIR